LQALPAWLRGRPWPGADSRATAAGFEQLGWAVNLGRYAQGWLEITRAAAPAVTLRARLEPDS
jgi:outer membrane lipoprotein LolB